MTPQLATTAFAAPGNVRPESQMKRWRRNGLLIYPSKSTQQLAAAVPGGFTQSGMSRLMQVVGAKVADALALRAARATRWRDLCAPAVSDNGRKRTAAVQTVFLLHGSEVLDCLCGGGGAILEIKSSIA